LVSWLFLDFFSAFSALGFLAAGLALASGGATEKTQSAFHPSPNRIPIDEYELMFYSVKVFSPGVRHASFPPVFPLRPCVTLLSGVSPAHFSSVAMFSLICSNTPPSTAFFAKLTRERGGKTSALCKSQLLFRFYLCFSPCSIRAWLLQHTPPIMQKTREVASDNYCASRNFTR
jgi:hypothetical protein